MVDKNQNTNQANRPVVVIPGEKIGDYVIDLNFHEGKFKDRDGREISFSNYNLDIKRVREDGSFYTERKQLRDGSYADILLNQRVKMKKQEFKSLIAFLHKTLNSKGG